MSALVVVSLGIRFGALDRLLGRRLTGWLRRLTIDQWRAIDAETVRDPDEAGRASLPVAIVLVTVAASLTLQWYLGDRDTTYLDLFPPDGSTYWELRSYLWWSAWRVVGYIGIPVLVLICLPGQRIADYYISLRG